MDISAAHSATQPDIGQSPKVALLSGGVGGARMARGLAAVAGAALTVVVNVGDDDDMYGVRVCADLDTVMYTLAGRQGPLGWGLTGDTFSVMDHLARLGVDTTFRLGDADLATCLLRSDLLRTGRTLTEATAHLSGAFGVPTRLLPATDDALRTRVLTTGGEWLSFQEYFVLRRHRDEARRLDFAGADEATPAPGVLEAIATADVVVVAPSNPPLSIWPILAVPGIRAAVAAAPRVVAISPLFGGAALKGPADRVMASLGLPGGTAGILAAYEGLLTDLVIDSGDAGDIATLGAGPVRLHAADTRISRPEAAEGFAALLIEEVL